MAGAKGKYHEWLSQSSLLLIKGWARDGLTDKEIAKNIGVSMSTFADWKNKFPEISETIKDGRSPVLVKVEDTFFTKKLQGYTVKEVTKEKTIHRDAYGNVTGSTEHVRENERYIPPDTTGIIFYLKCRKPETYNDRINVALEDKFNGKLADLIDGLKENDIHTETAVSDAPVADEPTETN